ncbi:3-dehydroquinate dehydratase, putative [Babesia ovis]|uniref:3-dehydroquinate dehydratase, putative n=1 Tax=Babesia ovis TaxID=5869 RepID=A0A9W5TCE6_BABOV|nr:3-dehydroquinate dehydratase, putative [Babesia ovis]
MLKWLHIFITLYILDGFTSLVKGSYPGSVVPEKAGSSIVTQELERFTLYKIRLTGVPVQINAEDFRVELIGTQFVQNIPPDLIFYPEFSVTMEGVERDVAVWIVNVRIPKYYELEPIVFTREEL